MKIIYCLLFLILSSTIYAQTNVKRFEIEIGGGALWGASYLGADRITSGGVFVIELRNNWHSKFDFGTQFTHSSYTREWHDINSEDQIRTSTMQVVFDYNYRQGKIINPFAGGGIGMAITDNIAAPCLMPRIGIEFFKHIRFTMDYKWIPRLPKNYGYWNSTIGIVLGGGSKKN